MSDGQQMTPLLNIEQEHVDQYSGWLTLEGDLLSLAEVISEMPNMCEESAKALISQYKRQHDHDRDLALALIEFGLRSMADPQSPHFAFKVINAMSRFGVLVQGVTDRSRLLQLVNDLSTVLADEMLDEHPVKDVIAGMITEVMYGEKVNLSLTVKKFLKSQQSADLRVVRLLELRRKHFIPTQLVTQD